MHGAPFQSIFKLFQNGMKCFYFCAIFSVLTLQLLLCSDWQTDDSVLQDFKTIVMNCTKNYSN